MNARALSWWIVAFGATVRVAQLALDPPMRWDEAAISWNVLTRGVGALLGPLAWKQSAPPGFLLAQKAMVTVFGGSEAALRAVPFACGLLFLVFFRSLALRLLDGPAALMAVALAACNHNAIFHAVDAKQYSGDLVAATGLLLLAARVGEPPFSRRAAVSLVIAGALAVAWSHPACFVLAGIATNWLVRAWRRRDRPALRAAAIVAAGWALVFAASLAVSRMATDTAGLEEVWARTFAPLPPRSGEEWLWYLRYPVKIFREPGDLQPYFVSAAIFLIGLVALRRRGSPLAWWACAPIVLALAASAFRLYPFHSRFLLFSVPLLALVTAEGWGALWRLCGRARIGSPQRPAWTAAPRFVLTAGLLFYPVASSLPDFVRHYMRGSDLRAPLKVVAAEARAGDRLAFPNASDPQFTYYLDRLGLAQRDVGIIELPADADSAARAASGAGRLWVVLLFESTRERLFLRERISKKTEAQRRRNEEIVLKLEEHGMLVERREFNGCELCLLQMDS